MSEPEVVARTESGEEVQRVRLGPPALQVEVLTWGATLASVRAPDRTGAVDEVLLGFDDPAGWLGAHPYLGATLGRYANRIAGGRFELDGRSYAVPPNDGPNALHGGPHGFDRHVWALATAPTDETVVLRHVSPDGDQGFPGRLEVTLTVTVTGSALRLDYLATTDAPTVVNLSNHAYVDLAGPGSSSVLDHVLTLDADRYLPVDETSIPLGPPVPVEGSPFDFRAPTRVGDRIDAADEQLRRAGGYDHAFLLGRGGGALARAARVHEPTRGRVLEVWTDQPAVQLYTANKLDGSVVGRGGHAYGPRAALCLETEHPPDAPNNPDYPSTVLRAGEELRTTTEWRFSVD